MYKYSDNEYYKKQFKSRNYVDEEMKLSSQIYITYCT